MLVSAFLTSLLLAEFTLAHSPILKQSIAVCKENEVFKKCGTCDGTCKNPNPLQDPSACTKGCFCRNGYVRDANGICIDVKCCPKCHGEFEEYTDCGSCDRTCENKNPLCRYIKCECVKGCFCIEGYERDAKNECIPLNQCPNCTKPNEVYKICGSECTATCDDRTPLCSSKCVDGCSCSDGYVLHQNNCILMSQCPKNCTDPNSEYKNCGTACQPTCEQKNPICTKQCVRGCFCKSGFIRNKGKCIPIEECPVICPGLNEIYNVCGRCDPKCLDPNPGCPKGCNKGCFCIKGHVRDSTNQCIPLSKCRCPPLQKYKKCAPIKPATCKNPKVPHKPCKPGCMCISGYVRDNSTCIKLSHCKKC